MRTLTRAGRRPWFTLLLLPLAASCGGEEADEEGAAEKPTVQLAFVSGASDGTAARRGIDLALAELNGDSTSRFRYAVTTVEGGDAAVAAQECERLAGVEGLGAIIGSQSDEALAACNQAAGGAGLLYLSIGESSGELCADNLFQIAPLPNQRADAEAAASELAARYGSALTVSDYFEAIQLPTNDRFVAALRQRDSTAAPAPEAARGYDAVKLLAAAAEAAGAVDRAPLLRALPAATFDGPRGPVSFPAGSRFATLNMFVGRTTSEGKLAPVSFRPAIAPRPACG